MQKFEHKQLIKTIAGIDAPPSDAKAYAEWIKAGAHLNFLRNSAQANEMVVYAGGPHTFVHSLVVPNDRLSPPDSDDLLQWNCTPFGACASWVYGGGRDDVWLERGLSGTGTNTLEGATQLVFGREFDGWSGAGRTYLEINQEYTHFSGIHWRPEKQAYCHFNGKGDLEAVVSVSNREDGDLSLVTFEWGPLEEYLAICKASLVRMFDLTLLKHDSFSGWSDKDEELTKEGEGFFFKQKIDGTAGYTRGVQIVRLRRTAEEIYAGIKGGERHSRKYAAFIAHDWRNKCVTEISTDPAATTNFFVANENKLPFELSPAFFRPEVLSKYKTDREKYTLGEREVTCRAAWYLKGIDVNEAGQVHAYICDLRALPYEEQLHWLSFNEVPKTGISERAIINDFEGKFSELPNPPRRVLSIVERWVYSKVTWWTPRDEKLVRHINTPLTASRDEWAQAFMDLSQLVVEGFVVEAIRAKLDQDKVTYTKEERSIALLERVLKKGGDPGRRLEGLRTVQYLRNKTKGHASGSDAEELARKALMDHETFGNHFRDVCQLVADELEIIERAFA